MLTVGGAERCFMCLCCCSRFKLVILYGKMDLWKIIISNRVDEMGAGCGLVIDIMLFHQLGCYAGNTF